MWSLRLLVLVICAYSVVTDTGRDEVFIKSAERNVDVSSQLVKINVKLSVENAGKSPANTFFLAAEAANADRLSYIGAHDSSGRELKLSRTNVPGSDAAVWTVDLRTPLVPGASVALTADYVYTKSLVPHPTDIPQHEHQLVRYTGNLYFYSPHRVRTQRTTLALGTRHIESFTKTKPFTQSDTSINYGPHTDVPPFSEAELTAHYRNDSPFLTVARIERWIEVSHWGNIAVEERIELVHSGAKLKGAFSRYDYQQEAGSGPASVRSYRTLLPAAASDVYYRDGNGNISTSALRSRRDSVELELRPRYPLFGGWRSHYTLGYNVPSYENLFSSGEHFMLRVRVLDHIHDDMHVSELITRIVLPEGVRDIKLNAPYAVTRLPDSLYATYLDTTGRVVVSVTKRDLVEQHIAELQIRYTFPRLLMLREPLLLVAALFALFLAVIVYVRLDFSIHTNHPHKE